MISAIRQRSFPLLNAWMSILLLVVLQELVVKAVSLAMARDGSSGGVVRTVIVRYSLIIFITHYFRNMKYGVHHSTVGLSENMLCNLSSLKVLFLSLIVYVVTRVHSNDLLEQ